MGDTGVPIHDDLLKQQTVFARFGELALKSDDLDQILMEACRLAGEAPDRAGPHPAGDCRQHPGQCRPPCRDRAG
jgi:hypothetical protein